MKSPSDKKIFLAVFVMILSVISMTLIFAEHIPEGIENITIVNSSRRIPSPSVGISSIAGNVSELKIFAKTVSQTWQGYYGNVTGIIVLDDSSNNSMYSWTTTRVSGEIYASEASELNWSEGSITCYNYSEESVYYLRLSVLESGGIVEEGPYPSWSGFYPGLGLDSDDADGVDETFVWPSVAEEYYHENFYVGTRFFNGTAKTNSAGVYGPCPVAYLFNGTGQHKSQFQEMLLYEKYQKRVIYTSLLHPDGIVGFNNQTWDFQMIVGENGHYGDTEFTTYYFYAELE